MADILWSEYRMPDGSAPGPDDVVIVDSNDRLIFDQAAGFATVKGLVVYGEFVVEDGGPDAPPIALTTDWALVSGDGSFTVGTGEAPFQGQFDLTLAGKDNSNTVDLRDYPDGCETPPDQCPVTGGSTCHCGDADGGHSHHVIETNNAFLMAMGEGATISIHTDDAAKESWTQLDATAEAGNTSLSFTEATGWEVGDRIAVASTDFDADQAEEFTIVAVSDGGRTVTVDRPIASTHYGEVETFNDPDGEVHTLDMRAEVGLLSRDVTIKGDVDYDDSVPLNQQADQYGGHTMVMHGGEMYLSGVELAYMGQAGILGRYPAHWHELGDVSGQYIRDSSIHHSFNKGVTVHNTQGAEVRDNVVFETISHNYYLEEEDTFDNDLIDNLGINARHVGRFGEFGGAQDGNPSNFYTPNADNTWTGNHAAGSDDIGFYIRLTGDRVYDFGTMEDNSAHSAGDRALYVHHRGMAQDGNPQGTPEQPQKAADWVISGFTAYKSSLGAYAQAANGTITDSVFAEMGSNGRFRLNTTIENSLIVGRSDNIGTPQTAAEIEAGRSLPNGDGNFQGWQLYDGPGSLSNVMFDGFTEPGDGAIENSNAIHKSSSFGLEDITWGENVAEGNKLSINGGGNAYGNDNAARGLVDVDGSISGVEGAMIYMRSTDGTASQGFNAGEEYVINPDWGTIITTSGEQSATLTVDSGGTPDRNTGGNHGLPFSNLGATRSDGEYANDIRQQVPLFDGYTYELNFGTPEQDNFRLYLGDADWGQSFIVSLDSDIPATASFTIDNPNNSASRPAREVSSMEMLEASPDTAVFRDADGAVHVKLVAEMAHGYLWPQPGAAMSGSLNSGVTLLVDMSAGLDLGALEYDDPTADDLLGPPPYFQGPEQEPTPPPPPPAPNQAPVAADDMLSLAYLGGAIADVLANDGDPDGDPLTLTSVSAPDGVIAEIAGDEIVVTALPGFTGDALVSYEVSDGEAISAAAIAVTVAAPDPVGITVSLIDAETGAAIAEIGEDVVITLTPDMLDTLTLVAVPEGDLVESIRFTLGDTRTHTENVVPYALYGDTRGDVNSGTIAPGMHSLTVSAYSENRGNGMLIGEETIRFEIVEDLPPAALDPVLDMVAGEAAALDVLAAEIGLDPEGEAVVIDSVAAPANGTVSVSPDGSALTFTPDAWFVGTETFEVVLSEAKDAGAMQTTATVTVAVAPPPMPTFDIALHWTDGDQEAVAALTDGLVLSPYDLDGRPMSIVATTEDDFGGSVALSVNGMYGRIENIEPFALLGDRNGDLGEGIVPQSGTYTLTYSAYAGEHGTGPLLGTETVSFEVLAPMFEAVLMTTEQKGDTEIARVSEWEPIDGSVFSDAGAATLALFATETAPEIGSVALSYAGHTQIENVEPYALFGNNGDNFRAGTEFAPGTHEVEVTVFADANGRGEVIDSFVLDFEVV